MNANDIKLGSVVWDNKESDWFQINNIKVLDLVIKNWETLFTGIAITENNVSLFFSDLVPEYSGELIIKYQLYKDNSQKCVAVFYGSYNKKDDPHFIRHSKSIENDIVVQFNDGNDTFMGFYQLKNNKRIYVKYIHELQNILDSLVEYNNRRKRA